MTWRSQPLSNALLDALLPAVQAALPNNLTGVYLCGSLALGGFEPQTSDIDILVVTDRALSDGEMTALAAVHEALPPLSAVPGRDYEVYYIDRQTLRRFAPGQTHVKVAPDEAFGRSEHRPNWVLERWVVREHGVTVMGPDPKTLIDPVSPDDVRWAVLEELRYRLGHWSDGSWPISELGHRGSQGFEVETVCRALLTAETGAPSSKREAVEWALANLPEPWHDLIEWSQRHKRDLTQDAARVPEVLALLRWAVERQGVVNALPDAIPDEVAPLIDDLFAGACQALRDNLVGYYLRGSLALGGFDARVSDVDTLVVTERPVSDSEFDTLNRLHARIGWRKTIYNRHYEASYVDRESLERFAPGERRHPTVGADWEFGWAEHRDNFVLERWVVREHGVVIAGPDPKTLIAPISPDELRDTVRAEFRSHMEWAAKDEAPEWMATRHYQAFAVETICRGFYTLETGTITTKPLAVAWALVTLPEPWS